MSVSVSSCLTSVSTVNSCLPSVSVWIWCSLYHRIFVRVLDTFSFFSFVRQHLAQKEKNNIEFLGPNKKQSYVGPVHGVDYERPAKIEEAQKLVHALTLCFFCCIYLIAQSACWFQNCHQQFKNGKIECSFFVVSNCTYTTIEWSFFIHNNWVLFFHRFKFYL